jgi:hypothetical protein
MAYSILMAKQISVPLFDSNLSKIKTKLRTQGAVTGNFGRVKSKAGSPLRDIGQTKVDKVTITRRRDYINRMLEVYHNPPTSALKAFALAELHRLGYTTERRLPVQGRVCEPYRGPEGNNQ